MKNSALQDWYHLIGAINACALLLVLIVIAWKKLFMQKSFLALSLKYLISFLYSLIQLGVLLASNGFNHYFGIINNLLDIPLMLFFLTCFMKAGIFSKTITKTVLLFVLFEIIVVLSLGTGKNAEAIIMGPGILLVLLYSAAVFVPQIKAAVGQLKETGKAFMITSVIFAYCCYSVVYLLLYIFQSPQKADVYAVYHLSSLISAILMVIGLILEKSNRANPDDDAIRQDKRQTKVEFRDWDELHLKS